MRKLLIILIIIAVIAVPAYLIYTNQSTQSDFYKQLNQFNSLLREQNYDMAKQVYDEASSALKANYNISLDSHAETLAEEAKRAETTQDALDLLYSYNEIGYSSPTINTVILYYEDLLQSNYIFEQGLIYYNNQDYENAMACFNDVLDYDENYQTAQEYLNNYQQYNLAWNEAVEQNAFGRSPQPNSVAYKDNYMYLPYRFTNSNAILKINTATYNVLSFPIVSNKDGAVISNINIVGDYIFFLLEHFNEENNAVYRITTSGDNLTKVSDCDYTYLITYRDEFYAVSKSKGLVKTNNYFTKENVLIGQENLIEFQMVEGGIFYTVENKDDDINTVYFYDWLGSEEIMQDTNLHYYDYGDDNIFYYLSGSYEYMYHEDMSTGTSKTTQLFLSDLYKFYGKLNTSVIFSYVGEYQQECIRVKDISNYQVTYNAPKGEISYVPMGICYETGRVVLLSDEGISFTTENMRIEQSIALPHINSTVLSDNEERVTTIDKASLFSQNIKTSDENSWIYSDDTVNITTKKVYFENIESTVYISHIYTSTDKWLQLETLEKDSDTKLSADNKIWAIASQAYDEEIDVIDEDSGEINTDMYVYNDDGMMIPYREYNSISAEKAVSDKAKYVFTQGEIILENYKITPDSLKSTVFSGRSAIGMVEPGHYVVIVAEDVTKENKGISLYTLANLFKDAGCISAYCFDSDYLFNIFDGEYIYQDETESNAVKEFNDILYYSSGD